MNLEKLGDVNPVTQWLEQIVYKLKSGSLAHKL